MRETILITALEEIKNAYWSASTTKDIATKALTDFASSTKEGLKSKEDILKDMINKFNDGHDILRRFEEWKQFDFAKAVFASMDIYAEQFQPLSSAPESGGEEKEGLDYSELSKKFTEQLKRFSREDFDKWCKENDLPNNINSDSTPVASHSVYDNNSIEQEAEQYALTEGYPQSDKEHFETTYWTQHNIAKKGFIAGYANCDAMGHYGGEGKLKLVDDGSWQGKWEPEVPNPDLASVASHTSTSSNSIEEYWKDRCELVEKMMDYMSYEK